MRIAHPFCPQDENRKQNKRKKCTFNTRAGFNLVAGWLLSTLKYLHIEVTYKFLSNFLKFEARANSFSNY